MTTKVYTKWKSSVTFPLKCNIQFITDDNPTKKEWLLKNADKCVITAADDEFIYITYMKRYNINPFNILEGEVKEERACVSRRLVRRII